MSREFSKCEQFTFKLKDFVNAMFSFISKNECSNTSTVAQDVLQKYSPSQYNPIQSSQTEPQTSLTAN